MWRTGEIPQEFRWIILVLVLKRTAKKRCTDLLKTPWKVVEALIDTPLCASLKIQNVLNRFGDERVMGTAITELNITQELPIIYHDPLFLV